MAPSLVMPNRRTSTAAHRREDWTAVTAGSLFRCVPFRFGCDRRAGHCRLILLPQAGFPYLGSPARTPSHVPRRRASDPRLLRSKAAFPQHGAAHRRTRPRFLPEHSDDVSQARTRAAVPSGAALCRATLSGLRPANRNGTTHTPIHPHNARLQEESVRFPAQRVGWKPSASTPLRQAPGPGYR